MKLAFLKRNNSQKKRFAVIGAISTSIDFGILFLLHGIGLYSIAANFISTGTAFIFSFTANRSYTFAGKKGSVTRQIVLYFLFTFFGIWVIQPVIIWIVQPCLGFVDTEWIRLLVAKLIATAFTLVWNYITYSRVVFKSKQPLGTPR